MRRWRVILVTLLMCCLATHVTSHTLCRDAIEDVNHFKFDDLAWLPVEHCVVRVPTPSDLQRRRRRERLRRFWRRMPRSLRRRSMSPLLFMIAHPRRATTEPVAATSCARASLPISVMSRQALFALMLTMQMTPVSAILPFVPVTLPYVPAIIAGLAAMGAGLLMAAANRVQAARPLPAIDLAARKKPLTIAIGRRMDRVFDERTLTQIRLADDIAARFVESFNAISDVCDGGVVAACKRQCEARQASIRKQLKVKDRSRNYYERLENELIQPLVADPAAVFSYFVRRMLYLFDDSDNVVLRKVGPEICALLRRYGYLRNGDDWMHIKTAFNDNDSKRNGVNCVAYAALGIVFRNVCGKYGQGVRSLSTVRPLYIKFNDNVGLLHERPDNCQGAYVDVSTGIVQLYYAHTAADPDILSREEISEHLADERAALREQCDDFDAVFYSVVKEKLNALDLPWIRSAVFFTTAKFDEVRSKLGDVDVGDIVGADNNVGFTSLARPGTSVEARVKTTKKPFKVSTKKRKQQNALQRQAHRYKFKPAKRRAAVAKQLARLRLDDDAASTDCKVVAMGDAFMNDTMKNSSGVGGYGNPMQLLEAAPLEIAKVVLPEPFSSRVHVDADGRTHLLKNLTTFMPQFKHEPGDVIAPRVPKAPPTGFLRGSLYGAFNVEIAADEHGNILPDSIQIEDRDNDGGVATVWSMLRGHVTEHFVINSLRSGIGEVESGVARVNDGRYYTDKRLRLAGNTDGTVNVNGELALIEVKSTMCNLDAGVLLRYYLQVQHYLLLDKRPKCAYIVVKRFSPISPVPTYGFDVFRVVRDSRFAKAIRDSKHVIDVGARACFIVKTMAPFSATLKMERAVDDNGLMPVLKALESNKKKLQADIGATLHSLGKAYGVKRPSDRTSTLLRRWCSDLLSKFDIAGAALKCPLLEEECVGLMKSFVYVSHGVKYHKDIGFVRRQHSAAHSIAWQARHFGNTDHAVRVELSIGNYTIPIGYFVESSLATAAATAGYNLDKFESFESGRCKSSLVYALMAACRGDLERLRQIGSLNGSFSIGFVHRGESVVTNRQDFDNEREQVANDKTIAAVARRSKSKASRARAKQRAPKRRADSIVDGQSTTKRRKANRMARRPVRTAKTNATKALAAMEPDVSMAPKSRQVSLPARFLDGTWRLHDLVRNGTAVSMLSRAYRSLYKRKRCTFMPNDADVMHRALVAASECQAFEESVDSSIRFIHSSDASSLARGLAISTVLMNFVYFNDALHRHKNGTSK